MLDRDVWLIAGRRQQALTSCVGVDAVAQLDGVVTGAEGNGPGQRSFCTDLHDAAVVIILEVAPNNPHGQRLTIDQEVDCITNPRPSCSSSVLPTIASPGAENIRPSRMAYAVACQLPPSVRTEKPNCLGAPAGTPS